MLEARRRFHRILPESSGERVAAADVIAFRAKVTAVADESMPVGAVPTQGGDILIAEVTHARGSRERPLTDEEIADKVRTLAVAVPECDVDHLIDTVWSPDRAPVICSI